MNKQTGNIVLALLAALGTIAVGIGVMNIQTSQKQNETHKQQVSYEQLLASRNAMEVAAYMVKKGIVKAESPSQQNANAYVTWGNGYQTTSTAWDLNPNDINGSYNASFTLKSCKTRNLFASEPGNVTLLTLPAPESECTGPESSVRSQKVDFLRLNADGTINIAESSHNRVKGVISFSNAPTPTQKPPSSPSSSPSPLQCNIEFIWGGDNVDFYISITNGNAWSVKFERRNPDTPIGENSNFFFWLYGSAWFRDTPDQTYTYRATVYENSGFGGRSGFCERKVEVAGFGCSMIAVPSRVYEGETATLTLTMSGSAAEILIKPGNYLFNAGYNDGDVVTQDVILPQGSYTYTATVYENSGQSGKTRNCEATLIVDPPPTQVECSLVASPPTVGEPGGNVDLTVTITKGYADNIYWMPPIDSTESGRIWNLNESSSRTVFVDKDETYKARVSYGTFSDDCEVTVVVEPPLPPGCTLTLNGTNSLSIDEGKNVTVILQTNRIDADDILFQTINGVQVGPSTNYSYHEIAEENKTFHAVVSTVYGDYSCDASLTIKPPIFQGIECAITTSPSNPVFASLGSTATVQATMNGTGPIAKAFFGGNTFTSPTFPLTQNIEVWKDTVVTGIVVDSSNQSVTCNTKIKTSNNVLCSLTASPPTFNSDNGAKNIQLDMDVVGVTTEVILNGISQPPGLSSYSVLVPNVTGTKVFLGEVKSANKKTAICNATVVDTGSFSPKSCNIYTWSPTDRNYPFSTWGDVTDPDNVLTAEIDGQSVNPNSMYREYPTGLSASKRIYAHVTWKNGQTASCNVLHEIDYDPCEVPVADGGACINSVGYSCEGNLGPNLPLQCRGEPNNGCLSCPNFEPTGLECRPPWVTITCPWGTEYCVWMACSLDHGFADSPTKCMNDAKALGYTSFMFKNCPPVSTPTGSSSTSPW